MGEFVRKSLMGEFGQSKTFVANISMQYLRGTISISTDRYHTIITDNNVFMAVNV